MLGSWIRAQRKRRGWTQEQLAARLGVSGPAVTHWERGNRQLTDAGTLGRLAAVFDVPLAEVLALAGLTPEREGGEIAEIITRLRRVRPSLIRDLALKKLETYGQELGEQERQYLLEMARAIIGDEERLQQEAAERPPPGEGARSQNEHLEIQTA